MAKKGSTVTDAPKENKPIPNPNIPDPPPEEKRWEGFALQAVQGLYPKFKNTIDYVLKKSDPDAALEVECAEGVEIDMGKVQEAAQKLADANPPSPGTAKPLAPLETKEPGYSGQDSEYR